MAKATMVDLNTDLIRCTLAAKRITATELASRMGYSASWAKDLVTVGRVKKTTAQAIANQLGINLYDLVKDASFAPSNIAEEDPVQPAEKETAALLEIRSLILDEVKKRLSADHVSLVEFRECAEIAKLIADMDKCVSETLSAIQSRADLKKAFEELDKILAFNPPDNAYKNHNIGIGTIPKSES